MISSSNTSMLCFANIWIREFENISHPSRSYLQESHLHTCVLSVCYILANVQTKQTHYQRNLCRVDSIFISSFSKNETQDSESQWVAQTTFRIILMCSGEIAVGGQTVLVSLNVLNFWIYCKIWNGHNLMTPDSNTWGNVFNRCEFGR